MKTSLKQRSAMISRSTKCLKLFVDLLIMAALCLWDVTVFATSLFCIGIKWRVTRPTDLHVGLQAYKDRPHSHRIGVRDSSGCCFGSSIQRFGVQTRLQCKVEDVQKYFCSLKVYHYRTSAINEHNNDFYGCVLEVISDSKGMEVLQVKHSPKINALLLVNMMQKIMTMSDTRKIKKPKRTFFQPCFWTRVTLNPQYQAYLNSQA